MKGGRVIGLGKGLDGHGRTHGKASGRGRGFGPELLLMDKRVFCF